MKSVVKVMDIIKYNWKKMVEFQMLYKLFSIIVFPPVLIFVFNISMKIEGYRYITAANAYKYITSPVTNIVLLMVILCLTFFTLLEISANIYMIDQSYQRNRTNMSDVLKFALKNAIRVFNVKNILMAVILSMITIYTNVGLAYGYLGTITIPSFITSYILVNKRIRLDLTIITVFSIFMLLRWMYAFHYFTLEKCSFNEACKKSTALNKGRKTRDCAHIFLLQFFFSLIFAIFSLIVVLIMVEIYRLIDTAAIFEHILLAVVVIVVTILAVLAIAIMVPLVYTCISVLFYRHKMENREKICHTEKSVYRYDEKKEKRIKHIEFCIVSIAMAVCVIYFYAGTAGKIRLNVAYMDTPEITAHRGASKKYPENTMSAFYGAEKQNADWIELDVQQTKDGRIIVMHDSNLKRTTGLNKSIWTMTYKEIEELDCGSWFSDDFEGEKIPLLSEVIEFAKENNLKLNIEIKPTGHEKNFEKNVVDIVNEYRFKNQCVVTSQVYSTVKKVKKYDDTINTVYVMGIAYGDVTKLKAADAFSIKSYYVTDDLVSAIHADGKKIYVWTVNREADIQKMMGLSVDNVITDNVPLAKKCIYKRKTSNIILKFVDRLLKTDKKKKRRLER